MWNVGVLIIPKSDDDRGRQVIKELETAGWRISPDSVDGSVRAYGSFPTLKQCVGALHAADEATAEIQPMDAVQLDDEWLGKNTLLFKSPSESPHERLPIAHTRVRQEALKDLSGGTTESAPSPTSTPQTTPTSNEMPSIPEALWSKMTPEDASPTAALLIKSWITFITDRQDRAAWTPSRDTTLLAHLEGGTVRSEAASWLLSRAAQESQQKVNLMAEAVEMSKAIQKQFEAWTKLARKVPPLLILSILISAIFVGYGLFLVSMGRLNGLEMALLAFIFALTAVSPATLLLVGRPLAGLDSWTPDAIFNASKEDTKKKEEEESKAGETKAPEKPVEPAKEAAKEAPASKSAKTT